MENETGSVFSEDTVTVDLPLAFPGAEHSERSSAVCIMIRVDKNFVGFCQRAAESLQSDCIAVNFYVNALFHIRKKNSVFVGEPNFRKAQSLPIGRQNRAVGPDC